MTRAPARPAPLTALQGRVEVAHRRHFDVVLADGERVSCILKGRNAQVAAGDHVTIRRVAGGGAIESVAPRTNLVYRSDAFNAKLLAANVTQIAGVVAPDIALDLDLVNRWIIAAESAQSRFVLFANKDDLPAFAQLLARLAPYAALGYAIVAMSAKRTAEPALSWLAGQHTVLVGQSGMGKSTLVNALVPDADVRTRDVSQALQAGRHTTTSTTLYPLPALGDDAWIVDSPGVKAFGLAHLAPEDLAETFVEMRPLLGRCRFRDCRHDAEPECAITAAVADGRIAPYRLALLHTLQAEAAFARRKSR